MCRLARLLGRPSPKPSLPPVQVPGVLRRENAVLSGADLIRSFGRGETKSYALKGVSVEFRKGDLNLLMGPSGSGKSTLLAVLSGLLRPDDGAVGALGQDVWRMTENQMERFRLQHCSYIFQGYNLFPALTAREQLEIVLKWGEGCSPREARKRSDQVLGQLGLTNKAHLRPAQMSGGEKQRVAIGRALVKNPTLVFADEPTAALDWENGQQVIKLLTENARERGAMVLVVTHDPRLVPFADKVLELTDGQLTQEGTPGEVLDRPDIHEFTPAPPKKGPRLRLHVPQPALA
ncbi:MAG: ABC transporter ATP-binding protein [Planctomycetaceae bacterium]|nr:ABC transporter ATP-binding protein [Planctomycetaceae bacterium]